MSSSIPSDKGSVLLLSGGIESVTLLHLQAPSTRLYPLFIDYGQRAAQAEYRAAQAQCQHLDLTLKRLDMSAVGEGLREGQEKRLHVPIAHRNLSILSLAVSYAALRDAATILIALNQEDRLAYPSASDEFVNLFARIAYTLSAVRVDTPFSTLTKAQIIALGLSVHVDYAQSYSCLLGYETQCGVCPQCEKRRSAFMENAINDPAGFNRGGD